MPTPGVKTGNPSNFSDKECETIRSLYAKNGGTLTRSQLAKRFCVSVGTIANVLDNRVRQRQWYERVRARRNAAQSALQSTHR